MVEFLRRGHYRTNSNGTQYWVSGHTVIREEYLLISRDGQNYVNGCKIVPQICPSCRKAVFFYSNEHGSKVYFDSLGEPWPKHRCFFEQKLTSVRGRTRVVKKPYADSAALERRKEELEKKIADRKARRKAKNEQRLEKKRRQAESAALKNIQIAKKVGERKKKTPPTPAEAASIQAENRARQNYKRWRETATPVIEVKKKKNIVRPK